MNITREQLSDLDIRIKVEIAEDDYKDKVAKQLKDYQKKAAVPGFRKGMAPMGLIQRLYKTAIVADEVQNYLNESLFKYIDDEKLDIMGGPLASEEVSATPDFATDKDFTFYFDVALMPEVKLAWDKVDTKMAQIKVSAKDIDKQVERIAQQYGKFETPETIGEGDHLYGKAVELDKEGNEKEGGMSAFVSFSLSDMKDDEQRAAFIGKKAEEKVRFNAAKAFTAGEIERVFRLETAAAKKFKADVELTISGCSRITPHELNEELFEKVFPGEGIKTAEAFRKAVGKNIEAANNEQCQILYVNQVRKSLLDNFDAVMPEAFLKRWILARNKEDEKITAETLEAEWNEKYVPGLKWELLDNALNKIENLNPSFSEIVTDIKEIIGKNATKEEGEDDEAFAKRIDQAAESIARDQNNSRQIFDKLYVKKTFAMLKKQLNPEVEKISAKEFEERAKA